MISVKQTTAPRWLGAIAACVFSLSLQPGRGQTGLSLNDLSAFKTTGKTWAIGADAYADPAKDRALSLTQGTGVLAVVPGSGGADLYTTAQYGDMDLEIEYMMAKGSNSGIYLQGRYELQLLDSWTAKNPTSGDNGGIYHRWDESKPEAEKGYEGYAPRQNVSRAPGLWQQLRISFQAPRFDAGGKKIENAKFLRVELNGVVIHEDVSLSGVTRGAMSEQEAAMGPLRFQGDHGPVAFRNIRITPFDKPRPVFSNISYQVYKGRYADTLDLNKYPPESKGTQASFSAGSINNLPKEYFIKYSGTVQIKEAGDYSFNLYVPGGRGIMRIGDKVLTQQGRGQRGGGAVASLQAGEFPFEMLYTKFQDWGDRSLGVAISGPGIREYVIGDASIGGGRQAADPILVAARGNTILRSFMDIPGSGRVVHGISVGSGDNVHYTYDLDRAAIVQVWRGNFLDATPMWYDRGDGSSRPQGAVLRFGKPGYFVAKLSSPEEVWPADTVLDFTQKGYKVDKNDLPTFLYTKAGAQVEDSIRVLNGGEGFSRQITLRNPAGTYYARLAVGDKIDNVNGLYLINNKSYYIRIDDAGGAKPLVRTSAGRQELLVPVQSKLRYSIIF
ncbi:MAG: DUF1080 domain-containing protein [Williamsia sp.]|nr:DUF1080 domain-containing protein [Williamsia sp.]